MAFASADDNSVAIFGRRRLESRERCETVPTSQLQFCAPILRKVSVAIQPLRAAYFASFQTVDPLTPELPVSGLPAPQ